MTLIKSLTNVQKKIRYRASPPKCKMLRQNKRKSIIHFKEKDMVLQEELKRPGYIIDFFEHFDLYSR